MPRGGLFDTLLNNLEDAAFVVESATRTIRACNPAAERMFGYVSRDLVGRTTEGLHVDPEHSRYFGSESERILERDGVYCGRFNMRRRDGAVFPTTHTVALSRDTDGTGLAISIVRDDSEAALSEQRDRLIATLGERLWDARDLSAALHGMLEMFCRHFSWAYGEAWTPDGNGFMVQTARWVEPDSGLDRCLDLGRPAKFARGEGLVGSVWENDRPEWIADLGKSPESGRQAPVIEAAGIKSLLAVPVSAAHERVAVLVFASRQPQPRSWATLNVTEYAAAMAGPMLRDLARREALPQAEDRFRAMFMDYPLPLWLSRPWDLRIVEANEAAKSMCGYDREDLRSRSLADFFPGEGLQTLKRQLDVAHARSRPLAPRPVRTRSNGEVQVALYAYRVRWEGEEGLAVVAVQQSPTGEVVAPAADQRASGELGAALQSLSPRERQVLGYLVQGRLTKEIAHELGLSPRTIDDYRASLKRKLGARTTGEVIARLAALGQDGQIPD